MKNNLYFQIFRRILLVWILYTLCRLVFYLYNSDLYNKLTFSQLGIIFAGGMRFDITAIIYTNLLFFLMFLIPFKFRYNLIYQAVGKYVYLVTNSFALLTNCMDTVYFRNTYRRTTLSIFQEFSNGEKIGAIIGNAIISNWYLALFWFAMIALLAWRYGKPVDKSSIRIGKPQLYYPLCTLEMAAGFLLLIVGIRSGVSDDRPLNLNKAGAYATKAIDVPLIVNTPFAVIKSVDKKDIKPLIFFEDRAEADAVYSPVHCPATSEDGFKNKNVMIIILESFSREYFGFYNPNIENGAYQSYTPFLDTLISKHSYTHRFSYGNGICSIDAPVSILMSIPAIPEAFMHSVYFNNNTRSLPMLLKDKGYQTAFFCGSPVGYLGFDALCNIIGIDRYFGMEQYGNDADWDGWWGIWDEEFLQFTALELNKLRQPFMTTLFTITSHNPFRIPKRYQDEYQDITEPIHRCIRYTDAALKRFFETAAQQTWFNNTLFVLVADHVNIIKHDQYRTSSEYFAVPIVFYTPDGSLKKIENRVSQQIDIMPTVLGYLGYDKPYFSFGFDLNETDDNFAFNYFNGAYQLITDKYLLIFDGRQSTGLYELRSDNLLMNNIIATHREVVDILEPKAQAFLQQYTVRMLENRLMVHDDDCK